MILETNNVVVFDLDDTLYNEVDFLKSAYKEIAIKIAIEINVPNKVVYEDMLEYFYAKKNVFEDILLKYNSHLNVLELLNLYRNHKPQINLSEDKIEVLNFFKSKHVSLGLLTDGRSVQQRNKIEALNLNQWFTEIVISEEFGSEKPNINNYMHFENTFGHGNYYYIADNLSKDFISPNKLNWTTICLKDSGQNIHKQNAEILDDIYLPKHTISSFKSMLDIIIFD
ncbi:HAD-IA family hydrolase [Algibacter sp.]|nr:HAD-IA family hydrolase [Algibacter sp.]MDA9070112.1 HAD-IA family hydrolase [Algibacter sp.]MDC1364854.1 HAD-IA family hydrolase [Algibacter sp.]